MRDTDDIIQKIKDKFPSDTVIYTTKKNNHIVQKWAYSETYRDCAMYYRIVPLEEGLEPNKPKCITVSAFKWTYEGLLQGRDVEKSDCVRKFNEIFGTNSCNFPNLARIFQDLGYAEYQRGSIVSKCGKKK